MACPAPSRVSLPSVEPLSEKETLPLVTGTPEEVTVAVSVTVTVVEAGLGEALTDVVVEAAAVVVVTVTLQPPAMAPVSPVTSSTTNRFQVPLGSMPVKALEKVVSLEGDGAGPGNESGAPPGSVSDGL